MFELMYPTGMRVRKQVRFEVGDLDLDGPGGLLWQGAKRRIPMVRVPSNAYTVQRRERGRKWVDIAIF